MFVWLLAALIVGFFAVLGFGTGAIRAGISMVGAFIALAFAGPLGKLVAPLFSKMGIEHPLWLIVLPALITFGIVWLVFFGLGFAAHHPVELHFKYKEDDQTRKGFETMNKALGLFLGLLTGTVLFFSVGRLIYSGGYLTTQTSSENEPGVLGYVNKIRQDMSGSGWDRTFAALDHTPPNFFKISDILGILYHNPLVHGRASSYPPFLRLSERQEFKDIGADQDLLKELTQGGSFMTITGNPKVQVLLKNEELTKELLATDLDDFRKYIETGKSPKYDDERILGRWRLDPVATLNAAKRSRQTITATEILLLRNLLTNALAATTLTAYVDGKLVVDTPAPPPPVAAATATDPTTDPAATAPGRVDPIIAQRYGLRPGTRGPGGPAQAPAPVAKPAPVAPHPFSKLQLSSEGTWKRNADVYELTSTAGGKEQTVNATINDAGRLVVPVNVVKISMFFVRTL
ncbi:MAG: CvpA family protein [Pedosphaera sp.]|nr:CvpA family protein [Pedosphaera sp.]